MINRKNIFSGVIIIIGVLLTIVFILWGRLLFVKPISLNETKVVELYQLKNQGDFLREWELDQSKPYPRPRYPKYEHYYVIKGPIILNNEYLKDINDLLNSPSSYNSCESVHQRFLPHFLIRLISKDKYLDVLIDDDPEWFSLRIYKTNGQIIKKSEIYGYSLFYGGSKDRDWKKFINKVKSLLTKS